MRETIDQFLHYLKGEKRYSENTVSAYLIDLVQFMEYRQVKGSKDWRHLQQQEILAFALYLKEKNLSASSIARKLASVRSFSHYLKNAGVITDDPTNGLKSTPVLRPTPKTMSAEEVDLLLQVPGRSLSAKGLRDKALLELIYNTGMRVSEITALNIGDANLIDGTISVAARNANSRLLSLSNETLYALNMYISEGRKQLVQNEAETALFVNHRGERLSRQGLWLIVKAYIRKLGLSEEMNPRALRHSATSRKQIKDTESYFIPSRTNKNNTLNTKRTE